MKYIDNKLSAKIVKLEDANNNYTSENVEGALEEINSQIKNIEANGYDDTQVRQHINNIKTEIGTEELTTNSKNIKGSVNELNSQIKNLENNIVNVKKFGAKGDGVTDDTQAIKKALSYFKNGTLFFPRGTYKITDEIYISDVNNIKIDGNKSSILCDGKSACLKFQDIIKNLEICDLNLISNYKSDNGIILLNIHHSVLNNVFVQGFSVDGIYVGGSFITTYNNVTSIENMRYGLNFDNGDLSSCNNSIRINDCNISKNGCYNLNIKSDCVYTINGLNAEQFDYIVCNGVNVYTKGSINVENARIISIDGLYIESYCRSNGSNLFVDDYSTLNFGTSSLSVECVSLNNFYISNNANDRVGIKLSKVRKFDLGVGEIKACSFGIKNEDVNNTITISQNTNFYNNTQNINENKKRSYYNYCYNFENVVRKVNIKGDNFIVFKANQNMYINRVLIYYLENSNNYTSHKLSLLINNDEYSLNLLPNKTAPFIQVLNIDKYINYGDVVYLKVAENSNSEGLLNIVLEKINVL